VYGITVVTDFPFTSYTSRVLPATSDKAADFLLVEEGVVGFKFDPESVVDIGDVESVAV